MGFEELKSKKHKFLADESLVLGREGAVEFICSSCDFYHEDEKEKLECAAFKMLRLLLDKKIISCRDVLDAIENH